jgi:hypothetical protein
MLVERRRQLHCTVIAPDLRGSALSHRKEMRESLAANSSLPYICSATRGPRSRLAFRICAHS